MKHTLLILSILVLASPVAAENTPPPCSEPEARQFDFWVGQWEVHAKGKIVGHNQISRIHGGCTLLEEYNTLPRPYEGKSFNYYDPNDRLWHQVWVDNGGMRLHLQGGFADGQMIMTGQRAVGNKTATDRITWTDNDDGTVRQVWDVSQDGGATWNTIFDGLYKPSAGSAQEN